MGGTKNEGGFSAASWLTEDRSGYLELKLSSVFNEYGLLPDIVNE